MPRLIEPAELSDEDRANHLLRQLWPAAEDHSWLPQHLRALKPLKLAGYGDEPDVSRVVRSLVAQLQDAASPTVALGRFLSTTALEQPEAAETLRAMVRDAVAHGHSFSDDLPRMLPRHGFNPPLPDAAVTLARLGAVDVPAMISWKDTETLADAPGAHPRSWSSNEQRLVDRDPSRLLFWLGADFDEAVHEAARRLRDEPVASRFARLAKGIVYELGTWMHRLSSHPTEYPAAGEQFRAAASSLFILVFDRSRHDEQVARATEWAEAVLRLWKMTYQGREQDTPAGVAEAMVGCAKRELGRIRADVARATPEEASEILDRTADHVDAATHALFSLSGLWAAMKPLLLLVRAAPTPVFAYDLSWWNAGAEPRRRLGVAALAQRLMFGFQAYARFEQDGDPSLERLRADFARFCLERLKTKGADRAPMEPSATWRLAYIRAASELFVNPGGTAHRLLHHARDSDPDPDVREAAARAYPALRHGVSAPNGMSPRRTVLAALWWLRQAHMLELGIEVDVDGARITRQDEVRFTTRGSAAS